MSSLCSCMSDCDSLQSLSLLFMWRLSYVVPSNCSLHACSGYRCRVKCSEWRCISASVRSWTRDQWNKTKLNYLTCFWNTRMKRHTWKKRRGKEGRQLHGKRGRDGEGGQTVVVGCEGAYKPNGTLMVNGGLRWHVRSHGIFYSLSVPCSCCCVFLHHRPPSSSLLPGPPSVFSFLLFFCGWLKFIVLAEGF